MLWFVSNVLLNPVVCKCTSNPDETSCSRQCRQIFSYLSYFINASTCQLWRPIPPKRVEAGCQFPHGGRRAATHNHSCSHLTIKSPSAALQWGNAANVLKEDANSQTRKDLQPTGSGGVLKFNKMDCNCTPAPCLEDEGNSVQQRDAQRRHSALNLSIPLSASGICWRRWQETQRAGQADCTFCGMPAVLFFPSFLFFSLLDVGHRLSL